MPFPFAAVVAPIVSAVGGAVAGGVAGAATAAGAAVAAASATTLVIGGVSVAAGGALTAAAISSRNAEKRKLAKEAAERLASRERERMFLREKMELDTALQALNEKYGKNLPLEKAREFCSRSAELLGSLEGNSAGLRKKGENVSADAEAAQAELRAMFEEGGWAKSENDATLQGKGFTSTTGAGEREQTAASVLAQREEYGTSRRRGLWFGEDVSSHSGYESGREREARLIQEKKELDKKLKALSAQYGVDIPREYAEEVYTIAAELLGALEMRSTGILKQGGKVSLEAEAVMKELRALFAQVGIKE